jgi:hypothetical protein
MADPRAATLRGGGHATTRAWRQQKKRRSFAERKATKKALRDIREGLFLDNKSGDTYFRTFGTIIGSESLTTVFGMETGVTFRIWSPEEVHGAMADPHALGGRLQEWCLAAQLALDRIESVGYMWPSIRPLVPVS